MASSDVLEVLFTSHPYTARVVSLIQSSIREDNKISGSTKPLDYRTFYMHFCLALRTLKSTNKDYAFKRVTWQTDVIRMCELTVTTLTEEQIARCLYAYFFASVTCDSEEYLALHTYRNTLHKKRFCQPDLVTDVGRDCTNVGVESHWRPYGYLHDVLPGKESLDAARRAQILREQQFAKALPTPPKFTAAQLKAYRLRKLAAEMEARRVKRLAEARARAAEIAFLAKFPTAPKFKFK